MSYLQNKGMVDPNNSTTTPLTASATFTGTATDVSKYPSVTVACYTDQPGTLYVDFSTDGTNWDSSIPSSISANTNDVHRYTVTRKYMRVRMSNNGTGAGNQTFLRVQTTLGSQSILTSSLSSTVQTDQDTIVVRPLDFNLMVAEGLYQNRGNTIKDGINFDIDTGSVPEDIWEVGGTYTGFPASAAAAEIVVAGADTGTVYYSYMASDTDTDYTFASKAVTGAGTYSLGHNIWRCNFAYYQGSATNVSDITIQQTGTANVFCRILATYGQTYCAAYTVPYGSSIYIDRFNGNMRGSATGSLDGFIWYKPYNGSGYLRFPFELQYGGLYFDDVDYLIKIPERVDFVPRITTSSANNLAAKFSYRFTKVKA